MFLRSFYIAVFIAAVIFAVSGLSEGGIVVTPERHVLELTPDEEKTVEYEIYNAGAENIHFNTDVKEWAKPIEDKDINVDSWLFILNKEFDVKAGEKAKLNVKVKAPQNATGEILAMIFLCYQEQKGSPLHIRYGNPLYLVIKGTERYDARINNIDCIYFTEEKRNNETCLQVLVNLTNMGNIHIKPDIKTNIYDEKGNSLKDFKIENGYPIFSQESYTYTFDWWDADLPDGIYDVVVQVSYKDKVELPKKDIKFEFKNKMVRRIK